jgi:hypothetical protein
VSERPAVVFPLLLFARVGEGDADRLRDFGKSSFGGQAGSGE